MSVSVTRMEQSGRRETVLAVAGLMLALFLVALDQTVVGTALPKIIADLDGFEHYAWVTTAYLLASTAMIPVVGKLGDIYGRKWFIIAGVAIFLAASALCGAAWGMTELILFRGLQGRGAGILFATFIPVELRVAEPIIPFSLFKSRVFGSAALLMFMVGIGMFGVILYTPLLLGMTAMGIICGQIIARVKRIKPFMIAGAVVMTFGIYLLTTLDVDSTQRTVALYLAITGLGLGPLMPSATLAVQSTVQKRLLGVATSATQFIRSLGSTVGTAVIGSLVPSGYADYLNDNAPAVAPARLINALEDPNALVSDEARDALDRIASAFPGGEQIVDQIVHAARVGLSNSIHDGFMFTLVAVAFAIVAAILMKNIRLGDQDAGQEAVSAPVPALQQDRVVTGITLEYLARRIEGANGDSPHLISAASRLVPGAEGSERERAEVA